MGQEIPCSQFDKQDYIRFHQKLTQETALLETLFQQKAFSNQHPVAGFEIEAWLLDDAMQPAAINEHFLKSLNNPLACAELAQFNIELNTQPSPLAGSVFTKLRKHVQDTWDKADLHAQKLNSHLLMIGTLPTLQQSDLTLKNMSNLNRYRVLNEQILHVRGRPIHLEINGDQHLKVDHNDVMLESATTSFQIHTQVPLETAHHYYNASIIASAPIVALCANSPFLFGKQLWHETRIPIFEQAIETGGYDGAAQGPLRRVSFGSDYARNSIFECFHENLEHFPILLPVPLSEKTEEFGHLRLHNGTLWRWNRPLIGFDDDGTPHLRIEHRTPAAGPTVLDTLANAAFYYGLAQNLSDEIQTSGIPLPFSQAKDNFYLAARSGLDSSIIWFDGHKHKLIDLLKTELIPRATLGLKSLGVSHSDIEDYLGIIEHRVLSKQNGCQWQRQFMQNNPDDFTAMTREYLNHQQAGNPVSQWTF